MLDMVSQKSPCVIELSQGIFGMVHWHLLQVMFSSLSEEGRRGE